MTENCLVQKPTHQWPKVLGVDVGYTENREGPQDSNLRAINLLDSSNRAKNLITRPVNCNTREKIIPSYIQKWM